MRASPARLGIFELQRCTPGCAQAPSRSASAICLKEAAQPLLGSSTAAALTSSQTAENTCCFPESAPRSGSEQNEFVRLARARSRTFGAQMCPLWITQCMKNINAPSTGTTMAAGASTKATSIRSKNEGGSVGMLLPPTGPARNVGAGGTSAAHALGGPTPSAPGGADDAIRRTWTLADIIFGNPGTRGTHPGEYMSRSVHGFLSQVRM